MQIKYKKVTEQMKHCGDCGERLRGNNSMWAPYRCLCGEWEFKPWGGVPGERSEYVLKNINKQTSKSD